MHNSAKKITGPVDWLLACFWASLILAYGLLLLARVDILAMDLRAVALKGFIVLGAVSPALLVAAAWRRFRGQVGRPVTLVAAALLTLAINMLVLHSVVVLR